MEKTPIQTTTTGKGIAIGKEVKSVRKLGLPLALALIVSLASVAAAFDGKECDGMPTDDICYLK